MARRLRSDQVMILLSSRSGAPDPRQLWERALAQSQLTRRLPLGGLTAEDLRRLSSSIDGVLLSRAASRRLHEHTGGHPLYARALLEELPIEALMEASDALPAPHSMSFLVLVRLAKLSPAAQDLVLAAAVLGSRCALSDAVRVADVADPVAALDEAVRAGLLVDGPPGHPRDVAFPARPRPGGDLRRSVARAAPCPASAGGRGSRRSAFAQPPGGGGDRSRRRTRRRAGHSG